LRDCLNLKIKLNEYELDIQNAVALLIENGYKVERPLPKEQHNKVKKENKIMPVVAIVSMLLMVCVLLYMKRDRVEKEYYKDYKGDIAFRTWVWVDGEIIKAWSTDPSVINDSIKNAQKLEGERMLKLK